MIAHYLFPIIISVCIFICSFWFRKQIIGRIGYAYWIHLTGFVGIYTTLVWLVFCKEIILNMHLHELDLNKDGIFTGGEITIGQKKLVRSIANDTARKAVVFTGIVYSFVITIFLFLIDLARIQIRKKFIKKTNA